MHRSQPFCLPTPYCLPTPRHNTIVKLNDRQTLPIKALCAGGLARLHFAANPRHFPRVALPHRDIESYRKRIAIGFNGSIEDASSTYRFLESTSYGDKLTNWWINIFVTADIRHGVWTVWTNLQENIYILIITISHNKIKINKICIRIYIDIYHLFKISYIYRSQL